MKKRIIAALTALVMVVTMIPVSAFATTYTAKDVSDLIDRVTGTQANVTVDYAVRNTEYKTTLDAYRALSDADKLEVKNSQRLFDAEKAFNAFDLTINKINAEMAKIAPLSITPADFVAGTPVYEATLAYKAVMSGKYTYTTDGRTVVIDLGASDPVKFDSFMTALLGEVNYGFLAGWHDSSVDVTSAVNAVNAMAKVDLNDVKDLTFADYNKVADYSLYTAAVSKVTAVSQKYLAFVKGYDKFTAYDAKVKEYDAVWKELGKAKTIFDNNVNVGQVNTTSKTEASFKALKDAMAYAEATFAKYGTVEAAADFPGGLYNNAKKAYDTTKAAYDKFLTKDKVEVAVRDLPAASEVLALTEYSKLVEYDKAVKAIDSEVVAILEDQGLIKKYNDVKNAVKTMFGKFTDEFVAADYAKRLDEAVAKIPADVTRKDVQAVNDAIKVLLDYKELALAGVVVDTVYVGDAELFKDTDGYTIVKTNSLNAATAIKADGFLAKALKEMKSDAIGKLAYSQQQIKFLADKDTKAADAVHAVVTAGDATLKGVKDEATAKAALKVIEKYDEEYAKLADFAKADYDGKYKKADDKVIADAKKEIAKYVVDPEKIAAANRAAEKIDQLLKLQDVEIKGGQAVYNQAVALIEEIEAIIADPTVYTLVEKKGIMDAYKTKKAFVEEVKASTTAPVAVIEAIKALKVIDEKADKATIDAAVSAYKAAADMYNALTATEKSKVSNYTKFAEVDAAIEVAVKNLLAAENAKIGVLGQNKLTDTQIATINGMTLMIKEYGALKTVDGKDLMDGGEKFIFDGKTAANGYDNAVKQLASEIENAAKAEFEAIRPLLEDALSIYVGGQFVVTKEKANILIKAADAVEALSDEAKEYAKDILNNKYHYGDLVVASKNAKALLLEYATVIVEDQQYTGKDIEPVVVVKDFAGATIDPAMYTVSYSNNKAPGTATVLVKANDDAKIAGVAKGEFKIIAPELGKVNVTDVLVNDGKIRVKFDAVDVEGVKYEVAYKETNLGADAEYKTIVSDDTNVLIENLKRNTKYTVKVRAILGDDVQGEYSDLAWAIATKGGKYVLPAAEAPTVLTNTGKLRVKSDIAGIDGDVKVQVYYKKTSEPSSAYKFVNGDDNILIEKLAKNTQYTVKVRYYIKDVKGEKAFGKFSPIVHATTR